MVLVWGMGSTETLVVLTNSILLMGLIQTDVYFLGLHSSLRLPPHDEPRNMWMLLLLAVMTAATLLVIISHFASVVDNRGSGSFSWR